MDSWKAKSAKRENKLKSIFSARVVYFLTVPSSKMKVKNERKKLGEAQREKGDVQSLPA